MTWCHLPTIFNQRRVLRTAGLLTLCVALITTLLFSATSRATAGINQTLSFSGRLLSSGGAVVPDGYYNIQFKIYQDGNGTTAGDTGGSLKWTETYINNGGTNGVQVKNGYFSVNLGSQNAFGTQVDWNQDTLWLSMNIAGSSASCTTFNNGTCAADGEMLPMKRITSVPFAINSAQLGGKTASNFVQLAQGVQTDASTNTSSIFINKTGTGNLLQLQSGSNDAFTLNNSGDQTFGANANHSLSVATASTGTAGKSLTVSAGGGGGGTGSTGGDLSLQGGDAGGTNGNGGNIGLQAGNRTGAGLTGQIFIGTSNDAAIAIGNGTLASGTQNIAIGVNNTAGGTTNTTIGSGSSSAGGFTAIQSKGNTTIATNGVTRATYDTNGNLYFGNGASSVSPANFTIQGTASSATGVTGGALTIQGGNATSGTANGGNLTLKGGSGAGSGVNGLVVLTTPAFQSSGSVQTCSGSGTSLAISQSSVDGNSVIPIASTSSASCVITLPAPTITTAGRVIYVTADSTSTSSFTLSFNAGGTGNSVAMRAYTTATMIWNGSAWTAAGASASTTLQAAYDNTIQNSGGAELIVSKTNNTNGLTIRDSSTNPVNGPLMQVQSSTAANLFSVSSNVTDYSSDSGAELYGSGGTSTFPSGSWTSINGGSNTVTRNTTTTNGSIATGQASVNVTTSAAAGDGAQNTLNTALSANMTYNVSFSARLSSGTFNDLGVYYSYDGVVGHTVTCATGQSVLASVWSKINCSFTAPASGITTSNSLLIKQATGVARTFYVDNLSVTISAGQNYATDGGVDNAANFATNWPATSGASASRSTTNGYDTSDSAQVTTTGGATTQGVENKLSVNPLASTSSTTYLYLVTTYIQTQASAMNNFTVQYSYDGTAAHTTNCVDYNTQSIATSSTAFTKVTCYIQTPTNAPTTPYVFFTQGDTTARTFYVDTFSMTLVNPNTVPNVQIGGGSNGGPVTLLTLDKSASAPIASNNQSLLGSMYYDTTIGKIQCYQASGWGSCGSAPDNIITLSPEYTNAVMHGTGVGTMTSDICSNSLGINDGSSGQPTVCGTNETRNFYKWTSPQASAQTYSIYVTYQLPSTLKTFNSGSTYLQGKTDSSNSSVTYQIYRSTSGSALTACGGSVAVSSGAQTTWQTGTATGAADPSTCSFQPGDSIVFIITASAASNANAYMGNLGFTFSNK